MAAPAYGSIATAASDGGSTSLALNVPASTADGDLLITVVSIYQSRTLTPPSGWTLLTSISSGGALFLNTYVYYRVASSEPASYNWDQDSQHCILAACLRVTGASASPFDTYAIAADTTFDAACDQPSVTTTDPDTLLVTACVVNAGAVRTFTPPTNANERADFGTLNSPDSSPLSMELATRTLSSAGSTGVQTANADNNSRNNGVTIALRATTGSSSVVPVLMASHRQHWT